MLENTPEELRKLDRWVCFRITDSGRKIPFTPGTNKPAKSDDPSTWRSFEEAVADSNYQHIGLAIEEPYVFIDLDEPQEGIFQSFDSYSQRSISGVGLHIIGRGRFKGEGIHPKDIGIFQTKRFCLFTADVVDGRNEIKDFNIEELQSLYDFFSTGNTVATTDLVEKESPYTNEQVLERCRQRFDSFDSLWNGNAGEDHSASDHALISMLADCTPSNAQVAELWFDSALCRPHRRNLKYVNYTLKKTRGKQEQIETIVSGLLQEEEPEEEKIPDLGSRDKIDSLPDGLVKEMADWIWKQAKYPLQEAALCAAFSIMSTVAGRSYQINGSGLNTWMILVAGTGMGKNEYQNGIAKIINGIGNEYQRFDHLFNGELASGPAVEDVLSKTNRCFCYFPEFDDIFRKLCNKDAPPHISSLKKALLNSFMLSGQGSCLPRRLKAKQKGEDENNAPIESPCLVLGGETTPTGMFDNLTPAEIESGFLQRFTIVESPLKSVSRRTSPYWGKPFSEKLKDKISDFFTHCDFLSRDNQFETIEYSPEATALLEQYDNIKRDLSLDNSHLSNAVKEYHTRAGIKMCRLAGLLAVASNYKRPVMKAEHVKWATDFVDMTDNRIIERFQNGQVGTGQIKQESEITGLMRSVMAAGKAKRKAMGIPERFINDRSVVPHLWLKKKIASHQSFATDKAGAVSAFERCLKHLIDSGEVIRWSDVNAEERFGPGCGIVLTLNG